MLDTNTLHAGECKDVCRIFNRQSALPRHKRTCVRTST